jgi:alanyl-tRNA synthetase
MATDEPTNLIRVKTTYTFDEAIEYMKQKDKQPTKISEQPIRWVNVKTVKRSCDRVHFTKCIMIGQMRIWSRSAVAANVMRIYKIRQTMNFKL